MELVDLAARSWFHIYARRRGGYSSSYYDDDDYDGSVGIAVAVWVVIVIIGFMCSLFFWATIYYTIQERKRMKQGHSYRFGHVLWSAFKIATFLWIPIKLYRCCTGRDGKKDGAQSTQYAKIDGGAPPPGGIPANNGWYGYSAPPAAASYGAGGAGYAPTGKFEPMGYAGAAGIAPSPQPTPQPQPQPGPAPPVNHGIPSPPPYGSPAPSGTPYGQPPAPAPAGAAQGYFPAAPSPYGQYQNQVPQAVTAAPTQPAQVAYNPYNAQPAYGAHPGYMQ